MSENLNGNGAVDPNVTDEGTQTNETSDATAETENASDENQTPETVPYARLSEVIAQRAEANARAEAEAAARAKAEYENQQLRALLTSNQRQATQAPTPWDTYQDPNTKALAQLVYNVTQHSQKDLSAKLDRFETVVETIEANNFWSRYPQVPAELQAKTEQIYAQAKSLGINRETALTFAYGEAQRAAMNQNLAAASASTSQQATVNRAARAGTSAPTAPQRQPTQPQIKSARDYLTAIEHDINKPTR